MEVGYIFTYTATAVGALCGWFAPMLGLFIYYMFAMLRPPYTWFWILDPYTSPRFSRYVAISTVIGWGVVGFGKWDRLRHIRWPIIGLCIYVGWGMLAAQFWAIDSSFSWRFLDPQWKILLMMFITISLVREAKHIKTFAWVITLTLVFLAFNFNDLYLQSNLYLWINGWGGVDNNGVAMIMVMSVPVMFFMGIHAPVWWLKPICLAGMLLACHVVLFTYSRGGQLGLIMVGILIFVIAMLRLPNKIITLGITIIAVVITLELAGELVRQRFASIFFDKSQRDESAESRFLTWKAGWRAMQDNPLGLGPRNFNLVSQNYGLSTNKSVHNLFLQTGADYGYPGLFGLCLFYFGTMWKLWRMMKTRISKRMRWPQYMATMVLVSMGGMMICSTFIGMESVEIGFILCILGLVTCSHVHSIAEAQKLAVSARIPELEDVRAPEGIPGLVPA